MYLGFLDCPIGQWTQTYGGWHKPSLTGSLVRLLLASWQHDPCGMLPDDDQGLAAIAGMSLVEFVDVKHQLMQGFQKDGRWWQSPQLVGRASVLAQQHGESLDRMHSSATATVMAPEVFSLHSGAQEVSAATRRRRKIPPGFSITVQLCAWAFNHFKCKVTAQGGERAPTEAEVMASLTAILELFKRDAAAQGRIYEDWDKAFMSFIDRQTNGEFGLCARYFPQLFPLAVTPAAHTMGFRPTGSYGKALLDRRAVLSSAADDALATALADFRGAGGGFDMTEPLTERP